MKTLPKFLLGLGILMTISGMTGAGITYMDMRNQRHLHDRLAGIKFKLSEQTDWQTESFSPYDTGYHTLHLATTNTARTSSNIDTMKDQRTLYHGIFESRIIDPSDHIVWSKSFDANAITFMPPPNMIWTFVDSVYISGAYNGSWKFQAQVIQPDDNFSKTSSELILMPPGSVNIGMYIYSQSLQLIGFGILMVAGFCTIVFGGYMQKRSARL